MVYAETSPQVHDAFVVVDCGGGTVVSLTTPISFILILRATKSCLHLAIIPGILTDLGSYIV